jgi:hypothetical protein
MMPNFSVVAKILSLKFTHTCCDSFGSNYVMITAPRMEHYVKVAVDSRSA